MTVKNVGYIDLVAQWKDERSGPIIDRVMNSGHFIGGGEVENFESSAAERTGSEFCVA